jgi:hypothetical protein
MTAIHEPEDGRGPLVACDGCGHKRRALQVGDFLPSWYREGRAPPGWRLVVENIEGPLKHYCPACEGNEKRKT